MPNPSRVPITQPRVPFLNPETGFVSMPWYLFLLSLSQLTSGSEVSLGDLQKGPPQLTIDEINVLIDKASAALDPSQDGLLAQLAELQKQVNGLEVQVRPELGTMSQLQQDNLPWYTFDTTPEHVPTSIGTLAWDGGTTLGIQMTANVLQQVGESQYYYIKADSTITKGQLIMFTGAVGASGVIKGTPATGLTDGQYLMGIAAENIAANGFGLVTSFGHVRGWNTTGSPVGETWVDGDILYYNPTIPGALTKTQPTAPNVKATVAVVVNAAPAGSGDVFVRVSTGSVLGGTDSNVQFGTLATNDLIQYNGTIWTNVPASSLPVGTATNLAGGAAGSVPYQTAPGTTTFRAIGTAGQVLRVNSGATAPEWVTGSALTKTDDTNVTLTLGGSPTAALLAATSFTLGWTGQLAVGRGGTGVSATPSNGQLLIGNGTGYTIANLTAGTNISIANTAGGISISSSNPGGTVTSVGLSAPTGFAVSGSPVTGSGTLALSFSAGYSLPTTASQSNWDTAYSERRQWDGGSTGLVAATGRTSLGATTVGGNMFTLTNPSAVTFPRFNADNTVTALSDSGFRTAIGLGTIATQNANNVAITGGAIDATPIGATTRANGSFLTADANLFTTASGTTSAIPSGTATTVYTLPNVSAGTWIVTAAVPGAGDVAFYNASSIVHTSGTSTKSVSLSTAIGLSISVSGLSLQVTQSSGISIAVTWTILRLS